MRATVTLILAMLVLPACQKDESPPATETTTQDSQDKSQVSTDSATQDDPSAPQVTWESYSDAGLEAQEQDPRLPESLKNLASLYYTQGKYAEAETLYQRALAIDEKVLGP